MTQKQSIIGRIAQLTRANINALIDQAEDPEKMLDQLIRDFTTSIADAEDATATTIGNLRMLEADKVDRRGRRQGVGRQGAAASAKADELRAAGQDGRGRPVRQPRQVRAQAADRLRERDPTAEPQIASQTRSSPGSRPVWTDMREKLDDLKRKRDELVARSKSAQAQ